MFCSSYLTALALASTLLLHLSPVRADNPVSPGFPYGSQKVRGVNIGGWLVLEPWITPSMFDATGNDAIVDEWTFCQLQSRSAAQSALQSHWNSFYSEADFAAIAAAGYVTPHLRQAISTSFNQIAPKLESCPYTNWLLGVSGWAGRAVHPRPASFPAEGHYLGG